MENNYNKKRGPGRPPGTPRTGGRAKGTPNKITAQTRKAIAKVVTDGLKKLPADLELMTPKDRADITLKLMRFVVPTLQAVEVDAEVTQTAKEPTLTPQQAKEFIKRLEEEY